MSTTTEQRKRVDTSFMYAVHAAFERDLRRIGTHAAAGTDVAKVRAGWDRFKTYLHIHHTAEDTHLWPVLRGKLVGRPGDLGILEQMEIEHTGLTALLDAADTEVIARGATGRLAPRIEALAANLTTHCRHEEELALPLVEELLSTEEWNAFGNEQRRQVGFKGAGTFFPWLLDGADEEMRARVLGVVPPPVRLLYRAVWKPRYMRGPRLEG